MIRPLGAAVDSAARADVDVVRPQRDVGRRPQAVDRRGAAGAGFDRLGGDRLRRQVAARRCLEQVRGDVAGEDVVDRMELDEIDRVDRAGRNSAARIGVDAVAREMSPVVMSPPDSSVMLAPGNNKATSCALIWVVRSPVAISSPEIRSIVPAVMLPANRKPNASRLTAPNAKMSPVVMLPPATMLTLSASTLPRRRSKKPAWRSTASSALMSSVDDAMRRHRR